MTDLKALAAKRVLDFYIERLEEDESEESKWCLHYIHIQMAKFKCDGMLNMLGSYPVNITEASTGDYE